MQGILGGLEWGPGTYLMDWQAFWVAGIIVINSGDHLVQFMGSHTILPRWRAYAWGLGVEWSLSRLLGPQDAHKKYLKNCKHQRK